MIKIDTSFMVRPFQVGFGNTIPMSFCRTGTRGLRALLRWLGLGVVLIGLTGCAQQSIDTMTAIDTMPKYDTNAVNAHYDNIITSEALYFRALVIMSKLDISEDRKVAIDAVLDKYIYHAAVARIHVFHGRWKESDQADTRSMEALAELVTLIQKDSI